MPTFHFGDFKALLHALDFASQHGTKAGEESFDVGHEKLFPTHKDFATLVVDGFYNLVGSLLWGDTASLACIHLAMTTAIFFKGIERDVGLHSARAHDGDADVLAVVFGLHGFEETIEGMLC